MPSLWIYSCSTSLTLPSFLGYSEKYSFPFFLLSGSCSCSCSHSCSFLLLPLPLLILLVLLFYPSFFSSSYPFSWLDHQLIFLIFSLYVLNLSWTFLLHQFLRRNPIFTIIHDTFLNSYHQNEAKNKEAVKGGIERKLIGRGNSVLSSLLLVDPVHLFLSVDAQIEPVVYLTMYCIHG